MKRKKAIGIGIVALVVVLALFDVQFNFELSLPAESRQRDAEQEARYAACYGKRDQEIHDEAFGTIDNPDVQKLYISNNRAEAAKDCRKQFPEHMITVHKPFHFNVIDLRFRF